MSNNVAAEVMAIVDQRKAEAAAEARVVRMLQAHTPQRQYGVRALSLMTIGRGAMIGAMRHAD